jgi:uncharacterized protein YkwD
VDPTTRLLSMGVAGLLGAVLTAFALSPASPDEPGRHAEAESYMYGLVDEARAEQGLVPLIPADDIAEVAAAWSAEMADTREFEHNPDHPDQICCWTTVTENIAWAEPPRTRLTGDPVAAVVKELHLALLDSPGHRRNLLDDGVDEIGIGVHVEGDGSVWVTQNFRASAR